MKRTPTLDPKLGRIAFAFAGMLGAAFLVQAGPLDIPPLPLGAPPGAISPNVMFILDASTSMGANYMPDYVIDLSDKNSPPNTTAACADSGDEAPAVGRIDGLPVACKNGDPPFSSPDFNTIYYNPGITYLPGVFAPDAKTGISTDMPSQNRANTTEWTQVWRDPYLDPKRTTTDDLAAGYPDRVWCENKSDSPTSNTCFQNTAYQYPDYKNQFGQTTAGAIKTRNGSPYFYRMQTAQYCSDAALANCVSGSAVVPATHIFLAPEYCTDAELTQCAAGAAVTPAHTFSGPRWCIEPDTLMTCQRKKLAPYIYPKHLGVVKTVPGPFPARANTGTINISSPNPAGGTISDITIATALGPVSVINLPIKFGANSSATDVANLIRTAINSKVPASDFTASLTGGALVTIFQVTKGVSGAGAAIAPAFSSDPKLSTSSEGKLTLKTVGAPNTTQDITKLSVNGVNLLCNYVSATDLVTSAAPNLVYVEAGTGRVVAGNGSNTNAKRNALRDTLRDRVNACAVGGYSATTDPANINTTDLVLIAPQAAGSGPNGQSVARSGSIGSLANIGVAAMGTVQTGVTHGDLQVSVIPMNGGQDEDLVSPAHSVRVGVGAFSRTDIVSLVASYAVPKGAKRTDCAAGTTCTYDEEMTNFGNWYAYYRTRIQMMKTAVGRAFVSVDTNYRVGFITSCPFDTSADPSICAKNDTSPFSIDKVNKYLSIADFTTPQKILWYARLYGTVPSGGTPLREALARVGQIYAGALDGSDPPVPAGNLTKGLSATKDPKTGDTDDPVNRSCQPNFALLSTDGYWNQGPGLTVDNQRIGNRDGKDQGPFSLQAQGVFDGGDPASSETLADVALYYYMTDLRPKPSLVELDNVPTTARDTASHQHMVTYTLGLGTDGQLSYDPKYETQTSGDFFDIKQGAKKWPVPQAGTPTALDDLWHAAVNGRGVFYSAKDPVQLAASLEDMRNQLETRLGAGANAATSNLQPVAGDNFAFTASFTTPAWDGDLKARTIDLSTGVVSTSALWSAAALLDSRSYADRVIYTFDSTDKNPKGKHDGTGNRLKQFCAQGFCNPAVPASDNSGLDPATEMPLFSAKRLGQLFTSGQLAIATGPSGAPNETLVNYLRGDRSYEISTTDRSLDTDLFRSRDSVMGDIVNAQPAYVKRSPFSYTDVGYADGASAFRQCTEGIGKSCDADLFPNATRPRRGTVYAAANDGMLHAFETDATDNPYFQTEGISTPSTSDDTFTGNNTGNGVERWAYIPGLVLPNLYKLANDPYAHTFLTDGTPQVGDIDICKSPDVVPKCTTPPSPTDPHSTQWRTILVAGLNSGGIGYYALDITNPLEPKALWEFGLGSCKTAADIATQQTTSDCNLGLTYGNAVITKLFDPTNPSGQTGRWVVIVASGYNNTFGTPPDQGDGRGYLYILDALSGKILNRLVTPDKSCTVPCGLARINGWTDAGSANNTVRAIYGGDLDGNLWRFTLDADPPVSPSVTPVVQEATKIAELKDASGNRQPITVKPELALVGTLPNTSRLIVLGTGKFLELSDKTPPFLTQTIYALKDPDPTDTKPGPLIAAVSAKATGMTSLNFVDSKDGSTRTVDSTQHDPKTGAPLIPNVGDKDQVGWRIDLLPNNGKGKPIGERVNIDPVLQLGTLVIGSNVPNTDTCNAGGFSFLNFLDVNTGSFVKTATGSTMASVKISSSLLVGVNVVMLPGGAVKTIATLADETRRSEDTPVPPKVFKGSRVSWRELFVDQ